MGLPTRRELEALATEAGAIALTHFHRVTAERKADRSLVTEADRAVEAHLASVLGGLLPEAAILGEEGAARTGTGPWQVVIDPIDGTAAFVAGLDDVIRRGILGDTDGTLSRLIGRPTVPLVESLRAAVGAQVSAA